MPGIDIEYDYDIKYVKVRIDHSSSDSILMEQNLNGIYEVSESN